MPAQEALAEWKSWKDLDAESPLSESHKSRMDGLAAHLDQVFGESGLKITNDGKMLPCSTVEMKTKDMLALMEWHKIKHNL